MKLLESAERQDYSLDIEENETIGRPIKYGANLYIQNPHNFAAKTGKNFSPFRKCDENAPMKEAKENKWKSKSQTPEAVTPNSSQNLKNM